MLTRKQHELLIFIDRHLKRDGLLAVFEEMKEALSLRSKSGIHRLISALGGTRLPASAPSPGPGAGGGPAAGEESWNRHGWRHLRSRRTSSAAISPATALPGVRAAGDAAAVQLPLYGRIAAGQPIEALRDGGSQIEVPMAMLGSGEHYALEVAGDSMIEAGILDGDTVIIRKGETAENGQIVVAMVDDAEVTLKRLRRRGNMIVLEPANHTHVERLFPESRVKVQGRLVGLLRRY